MKKSINIILRFLLAITIIVEITYTSMSNSITENKIRESIKNNLLTGLIYDDNGNKTQIFNTIVKLTKLDEQTTIKLMENPIADGIITDIVDSIYDYNLTGDISVKYTAQEIIDIVENNIDKLLTEINYPITPKEREMAINYTENNINYILDTIYSTNIGDYNK